MAQLHALPIELTLRIFAYLPPKSHLDFALTSKHIAAQADDVFKHHRRCREHFQRIRIATANSTLHSAWRAVLDDPIVAFHVRELELDHSGNPSDKDLPADDEDKHMATTIEVERLLEGLWSRERARRELDGQQNGRNRSSKRKCKDAAKQTVGDSMDTFDLQDIDELQPASTEASRDPREDGVVKRHRGSRHNDNRQSTNGEPSRFDRAQQLFRDSPLVAKQVVLLSALCPRLRSLRTLRSETDGVGPASTDVLALLGKLAHTLSRCWTSVPMAAWPRGFANIRSLSICSLDTFATGGNADMSRPHYDINRLCHLPALESLRVSGLHYNLRSPHSWGGTPLCSFSNHTVRHLLLEGSAGRFRASAKPNFIGTLKELRSVVLINCQLGGFDAWMEMLFSTCRATLETFVMSDLKPYPRYPFASPRGWNSVAKLQVIRTMTIDVLEMFPTGSHMSRVEQEYRDDTHDEARQRFVQSLPSTLESLIFLNNRPQDISDDIIERVGDAIVQLVDARECPGLNAIYTDSFESTLRDWRRERGVHVAGGWFRKTKARVQGMRLGVTMYTLDDIGATDTFLAELYRRIDPRWAVNVHD